MSRGRPGPTPEILTARIAALVKVGIAQSGLSTSGLAKELKMPRQRLARIASGEVRLYLDEVEKLMSVFSIKPEQIWPEFSSFQGPSYVVDVPARAGGKVQILVNLVER